MNFDLLESFILVKRYENFTKAAEALYIPQPTLSNRIKQLENELGVILFERTKKSVKLTESGHCFYLYAKEIIETMNKAKIRLNNLNQGYKSTINIAFYINFFYSEVISDLMPFLINTFPQCKFFFHQTLSLDIDMIKEGKLDMAIIPFKVEDKNIVFKQLNQENVEAIVSPDHNFASEQEVTIQDICSQSLISFKLGTLYKETSLDMIFQNKEISYKIITEINDLETIKQMVKKDIGIALLPKRFVKKECEEGSLVSVPIKDCPFPPYITYVAYKGELRKRRDMFLLIIEELEKILK